MALGKRVTSPSPYTRSTSLVLRISLLHECDKPLFLRHCSPWFQVLLCLCGLGYSLLFSSPVYAQSTTLVISQIYGGGGNSGATLKSDFIEIRNISTEDIPLTGMSVQYASTSGSMSEQKTILLGDHIIPAGGFFLIPGATGNSGDGEEIPTPDVNDDDMTIVNIATGGGKVALVAKAEPISGIDDPDVIDFVGYGNKANEAEGVIIQDGQEQLARGPASSNTKAIVRRDNGCTDSDNNANDFEADTPSPRNSEYEYTHCPTPTLAITPTVAITATVTATTTVTPSSTTPAPTIPVTLTVPTATDQPHYTVTLTVTPFTPMPTVAITPTIATPTNTPVPAGPPPSPTPSATPTATMTLTPTSTLTSTLVPVETATLVPTPTPAPQLWLTEVMFNPAAVNDSAGEYIEIFNPNDFAVDLFGWILRDDGSDNHAVAEQLSIFAHGYVVLARNGDAAINGGLQADYVYSNLQLGNTSDQLYLIAPDDTTIDFVLWNKEMSIPLSAGVSLERDALGESTSWMLASSPWVGSAGDSGSPGQAAHPVVDSTATPIVVQTPTVTSTSTQTITDQLPTSAPSTDTEYPSSTPDTPTDSTQPTAESTNVSATPQPINPTPVATLEATPVPSPTTPPLLLISEVMVNPKVVADGSGEYIEIWNGESEAVNLAGYQLVDLGSDVYVISDNLWIQPNGFALLARNNNPTENGGIQPDYLFSKLDLANSSDELLLLTPDGVELDRLVWLEDGALSVEAGASFARAELSTTSAWVVSTEPWFGSLGDFGSPGQAYISSANVNRDDADTGEYRTYYFPVHVSDTLSNADTKEPALIATQPQNLATTTATPIPTETTASTPQPDTVQSNTPSMLYLGEVMPNPKAVTDSKGEFVEICNGGEDSLNLQSWSLSDLDKERHIIEEPLWVSAYECVVLGRNSVPAENGGVVIHHLYKGINLTNSADTLALLDAAGNTIDSVTWSEEEELISAAGASFEQIVDSSSARWRIASNPWAGSAGDFGSPGEMSTIQIADTNSEMTPSATPSPYPTQIVTSEGESPVEQESVNQAELPISTMDSEEDSAAEITQHQGEPSLTLQASLEDQPEPSSSADSRVHYPQIWITSFLADPVHVSDQKGEWLTLSNPNHEPVNLNGWMLADGGKERHIIEADLVIGANDSILLARSAEVADALDVQVDYVYAGFTLANNADEIILISPDHRVIDSIAWGDETEVQVSAGTIFQRQLANSDKEDNTSTTTVAELPNPAPSVAEVIDVGPDAESTAELSPNRLLLSNPLPSPTAEIVLPPPAQTTVIVTSPSVSQKQNPIAAIASAHFKSSLSTKSERTIQTNIVARPSAQVQQETNNLSENAVLNKSESIDWHRSSLAQTVINSLVERQTDGQNVINPSGHREDIPGEPSSPAFFTTCVDRLSDSDSAQSETLCGQIGSHQGLPTLFFRTSDIDINAPAPAGMSVGMTHIDSSFFAKEGGQEAFPKNEPQIDLQLKSITNAYILMFILFILGVMGIVALHWIMIRSTYHRLLELQNTSNSSSDRAKIET